MDRRPAALPAMVAWLDELLQIRQIPDHDAALNGLQVENRGTVARVVAAVDASQASIDAAAEVPGSLLLVHHGLFWDGNRPVTERRYQRLRSALAGDVAVYSAHLPLDVHAEVGNNALLAAKLGLEISGPFGRYKGVDVGLHGVLELDREELGRRLRDLLGVDVKLIPGGPQRTRRVALVTGGAGASVVEASVRGCDTFITGEGNHHTWFDAMEGGVNLVYAGHWATETLGVQALAARVAERFGVPWSFFAQPTGL
ncbi:MAG TPA: Nif3-like dinuclear metal center hexameric protein [Gemmatimonadales bacterium]|nr:Nif3-like dinuclear metal center hexameric protein [Gemmatimonadales bacterium]